MKVLAFDVDGTLLDATEADKKLFPEIYRRASFNTGESYQRIKNKFESVPLYLNSGDLNPEWFNLERRIRDLGSDISLSTMYQKFKDYIVVYEEVGNLLLRLIQKGKTILVISDMYHDLTRKKLELAGLINSVNGIFTSDMCGMLKNNPKFFLRFLKSNNLKKDEILVIDDMDYAIASAKIIGIKTVKIDRSENKAKDYFADFIINRLDEILSILDTIF